MAITPALLPQLLTAIIATIEAHQEAVTALDQAIGDGDHVYNLQRGLQALQQQSDSLAQLDWPSAWQKIGFSLMSTVGGASGSLYGTLFISMSKAAQGKTLDFTGFAAAFAQGVEAMKQRGKTQLGEKTLLDVLIPVAAYLQQAATEPNVDYLNQISQIATQRMEATRDMLATKGRASFLGERSLGHIDAGAKTAQLMLCAIVAVLKTHSA